MQISGLQSKHPYSDGGGDGPAQSRKTTGPRDS